MLIILPPFALLALLLGSIGVELYCYGYGAIPFVTIAVIESFLLGICMRSVLRHVPDDELRVVLPVIVLIQLIFLCAASGMGHSLVVGT